MIRFLLWWITGLTFFVTSVAISGLTILYYYGRGLPKHDYLQHYEPPALTRIHAADGQIIRELAKERRIHAPLSAIPPVIIQAFLSAEDKSFYYHFGIDAMGVLRAILVNSISNSWNSRPGGASTITQQVAKNFLVGSDRSIERKIKEAIMAFRLERSLSKDRILELYLNQIYLGQGAYGVVVAAQTYFNKPLDQISLTEAAFLASLPKAPSFYPSEKELTRLKSRRDWIIERMAMDGWISEDVAIKAQEEPIVLRAPSIGVPEADFFGEEVRRSLLTKVSKESLDQGGLTVRATLDPDLQAVAGHALRQGLIAYDRRHGWRGPLYRVTIPEEDGWKDLLKTIPSVPGLGSWQIAVVLGVSKGSVRIGLQSGGAGTIPLEALLWARLP